MVKSGGIILKVPMPANHMEIKTIIIPKCDIVKVLVSFQKILPVLFYYVVPHAAQMIREALGMVENGDFYFDPISSEEAHRRITILPEYITDDARRILTLLYRKPPSIMDELNSKEANEILIRTCPKELNKVMESSGYTEVKQLLIYPPGKGGISINTEDYLCLAQDQFLNDVIIDFYIQFLLRQLPPEQQTKVHAFSTFFYKRLTTKAVRRSHLHGAESDATLTASEKRHARVKKWTKNVNLFDKEFIIIPINENCHWFLAIICFPCLEGTVTMDGNPITIESTPKKSETEHFCFVT